MQPQGKECLCSAGEEIKNRFQALQNLEEEAVHPETEINRVASVCKESSEEAWSSGREGRGKNG